MTLLHILNVGAETPRQYLMAGSVVVTLPILFIFVYFEKYLVSGLTSGSVIIVLSEKEIKSL